MKNRYYAIKNNKIICTIDYAPFSHANMDKLCREKGFDGWFELDEEGALLLMQVDDGV